MSLFQHQNPTSSNKRPRPDVSMSTEESYKRVRLTTNKRERPEEEEGAHYNEDALQSFKRLRVNETSSEEEEHQTPSPQHSSQHTSQQAGQDTSSNEVPNYNSMNRLLGQLHKERLRHGKHAQSHLPSDSQLF